MNKITKLAVAVALTTLAACGAKVDVPAGTTAKIMTKDGYQPNLIPPSTFRLPACWTYCDKLVLLDTSDKAKTEDINIFIPTDKLNLQVGIRVTLSVNPKETSALFGTLRPEAANDTFDNADRMAVIGWDQIYNTYAQQVILTETREYLSQYSIAQISSSLEKVNGDLRTILSKKIEDRTPFTVRYVGITNINYPKIITDAQENAAERRERIQQEEAQLNISRVKLERELEEARLQRQIDIEKAKIAADAQTIQKAVIDEKAIKIRELDNQAAFIAKWNGTLPSTVLGDDKNMNMLFTVPAK